MAVDYSHMTDVELLRATTIEKDDYSPSALSAIRMEMARRGFDAAKLMDQIRVAKEGSEPETYTHAEALERLSPDMPGKVQELKLRELYGKLIPLVEDCFVPYFNRGVLQFQLGRREEAAASFIEAAAHGIRRFEEEDCPVETKTYLEQWPRARDHFKRYLELEPHVADRAVIAELVTELEKE
ncbi:hypothetical protein EDS67_18735 [candidate division KSB1 bacterium]|nr:MAG: hypothetical protein EDS67_18735 [candidate division KSB1 bacterium]MCE7944448.1 hypothetical protein [Chlorobi bacterium CHB1]